MASLSTIFSADSAGGTARHHIVRAILTNAEIKALPTTPIDIVSAPGSGFRIKPIAVSLTGSFAAGAYTNINTTFAAIGVQNTTTDYMCNPLVNNSTAGAITDVSTFLALGYVSCVDLSPVAIFPSANGSISVAATIAKASNDNSPLQVFMDNNGSGVLTGGNAANTLTIIVSYNIEPTS
jgi:hypothetical protein